MDLFALIVGLVVGAVGALTIEHGWGWVLSWKNKVP